jgi:hypothetical protein
VDTKEIINETIVLMRQIAESFSDEHCVDYHNGQCTLHPREVRRVAEAQLKRLLGAVLTPDVAVKVEKPEPHVAPKDLFTDVKAAFLKTDLSRAERIIKQQEQMVQKLSEENQKLALSGEANWRLREAIKAAGFSVLAAADKWTLVDITEQGKALDQQTLDVANRNVELEVQLANLVRALNLYQSMLSSSLPEVNSHPRYDEWMDIPRSTSFTGWLLEQELSAAEKLIKKVSGN